MGDPISERQNVQIVKVIHFGDLKKFVKQQIVDVCDHATVFIKIHRILKWQKKPESRGHNQILGNYQPVSENRIQDFADKIRMFLPENIKLHFLKLQETETSYAESFASDRE